MIKNYSGTSPEGHLTNKVTSPLGSPFPTPKLNYTLTFTPCNTVTYPLRSLLPSPMGDLIIEVPLYCCCTKPIGEGILDRVAYPYIFTVLQNWRKYIFAGRYFRGEIVSREDIFANILLTRTHFRCVLAKTSQIRFSLNVPPA